MQDRESRLLTYCLWVCALAVCLVLTCANFYMGDLNQDEGWYLYAARLVHEGQMPYRDFAFTQGPVMAYAYSIAYPLVASGGVAAGRLVTALIGFAATLCAAWLAFNTTGTDRRRAAALATFTLIAVNVYQSYFFTIVKTYSLCALLLMLGFVALSFANRRYGQFWTAIAGALMTLAAGTRISIGIVLPVVFLFLFFGGERRRLGWLWFALGSGVTVCMVFVPLLVASADNVLFGMVKYHSGRVVAGLQACMVYKAGFISRVVQAYCLAISLFAGIVLFRLFRISGDCGAGTGQAGRAGEGGPAMRQGTEDIMGIAVDRGVGLVSTGAMQWMMWTSVAAVTMVHIWAPFPYDDYQVAIFPLFAAALSCVMVQLPSCRRAVSWLLVTVFVLSVLSSFSSPINQSWVIRQRDRIWWRMKDEYPLKKLQKAGAIVRELGGKDLRLLTQDTYLAVEAGMRVPPGLEMGPFSYYPGLDDETASKRRVLNARMMKDLLRSTDCPVAAISGYGLAIRSPGVVEIPFAERTGLLRTLKERFRTVRVVSFFGQDLTDLKIMTRLSVPRRVESQTAPDSHAAEPTAARVE